MDRVKAYKPLFRYRKSGEIRLEVVEDFTRAVCEKLGEALAGDLSITEVRHGFGSFIKIITAIAAKDANNRRT